ncbi:hypothetical protein QQZ08_012048 [Neonectria magnoliae]|uniref:Uncharacterized protein n=1 Tax=Neonectria magnoliae TaxID=2732573 RepID=A0ABR1H5H8_9HYPO
MYRRLEFRGREHKLAKALRAFSLSPTGFSQSSQGIDLRHSTRCLAIRLEQPPQMPGTKWRRALDFRARDDGLDDTLPWLIVSSIQKIPKLKSLVLDLDFLRAGPLRAYSDRRF